MTDAPILVIVDLETTGLLPARDQVPLEIGLRIFDWQTWETVDYWECVIQHDDFSFLDGCVQNMVPDAQKMHKESGLLDEVFGIDEPAWPVENTEIAALLFLKKYFGSAPGCLGPMVGNSVHFDREYLREWMPRLFEQFGYRNIDVSTIKELCKRFNPRIFEYVEATLGETRAHRVKDDTERTLRELEIYSDEFLFVGLENKK